MNDCRLPLSKKKKRRTELELELIQLNIRDTKEKTIKDARRAANVNGNFVVKMYSFQRSLMSA